MRYSVYIVKNYHTGRRNVLAFDFDDLFVDFDHRLRPRISTSTSTNFNFHFNEFQLDFDECVLDFDDLFLDFDEFGLKLIFGHMKMICA